MIMAKTLIDIEQKLLDEAAAALGTRTKKDTVARALGEVVKRARREALIKRFTEGEGYPDLGDPEVMKGAWR